MKNTLMQNVISNARLMDKEHFLEWFWENKEWMIEQEKKQIIEAYEKGFEDVDAERYYKETFHRYGA